MCVLRPPPRAGKNWYCDPKTGCFSEPVVCPDGMPAPVALLLLAAAALH
jgi:hypothetical protein